MMLRTVELLGLLTVWLVVGACEAYEGEQYLLLEIPPGYTRAKGMSDCKPIKSYDLNANENCYICCKKHDIRHHYLGIGHCQCIRSPDEIKAKHNHQKKMWWRRERMKDEIIPQEVQADLPASDNETGAPMIDPFIYDFGDSTGGGSDIGSGYTSNYPDNTAYPNPNVGMTGYNYGSRGQGYGFHSDYETSLGSANMDFGTGFGGGTGGGSANMDFGTGFGGSTGGVPYGYSTDQPQYTSDWTDFNTNPTGYSYGSGSGSGYISNYPDNTAYPNPNVGMTGYNYGSQGQGYGFHSDYQAGSGFGGQSSNPAPFDASGSSSYVPPVAEDIAGSSSHHDVDPDQDDDESALYNDVVFNWDDPEEQQQLDYKKDDKSSKKGKEKKKSFWSWK